MDYVEYKLIREGLIALLCVGDRINCIYTMVNGELDLESDELIPCESESHTIRHYTVAEVSDGHTIGIKRDNHPYRQPLDNIFAYQGKLYVYNNPYFRGYSHETTLKKVIYIIEKLRLQGRT
jgi:hypothetical protein